LLVESFEAEGRWWLPETPEKTTPGRLTVAADGRADLSLVGAVDSFFAAGETTTENGVTTTHFTESSMERGGTYPRILGEAAGKRYTLENCTQSSRHIGGGYESQRIHVGEVFKGVLFEPDEEAAFSRIDVEMDWLPFWVDESALDESHLYRKVEDGPDKLVGFTIEVGAIEPRDCQGQDATTVTLGQTFRITGNRITERSLRQDFYFSIAAESILPLGVLLDQASDLQDLVAIGTGRMPAYSSVEFRHPDVVATLGDKSYEMTIEMFAQWQVVNDRAPDALSQYDMFFTLPELGGMSGVERWLSVAALNRSELGRVMATRYSKSMYVSDRLMNCAASVEAYDRRKHGGGDIFADRLTRAAGHAGDVFQDLVHDVEKWVKAVKDARNDIAHHKARLAHASMAHVFLGRSAYLLFVLCLLRDSQAPDKVFTHIAQNPEFTWLKRRLAEMF
jgi:hypothetical protein